MVKLVALDKSVVSTKGKLRKNCHPPTFAISFYFFNKITHK